jgi:2'-5' RNA ligase
VEPIRAFLAVDLGDETRAAAADVVRRLRGRAGAERVRFVRAENLHVTLRFLGDVDPGRTGEIAARVRAEISAIAPFELRLGALHAFPSERRARVVALALEPEAPLATLAAAAERGVVAAGLPPEARAFNGHLTLGRIQGGRFPDAVGLTPAPAPMTVREIVLYRSQLGPGGSQYTPLERMPLGGNPSPQTQP